MKKIISLILFACLIFILSACGNKHDADFKDFQSSLNDSKSKEHEVKKTLNKIHIEKLDSLRKTDTTDKNKKEINDIQNEINSDLVPKIKAYEKSTNDLKAKTSELKGLKKTYKKDVKKQVYALNELKRFVDLCNQSIKANEDILDYTKLFEKNRSIVENNMKTAEKSGNSSDVATITKKIEDNNKELKQTAEKSTQTSNPKEIKASINNDIMPLINKQIKDLNQTNISDEHVNAARKHTIEMYYSLQNYYETREETLDIGQKLSTIDYKHLPKEGKDLDKYQDDFDKEFKKIKSKYN